MADLVNPTQIRQHGQHRGSNDDLDVFSDAKTYYSSDDRHSNRHHRRNRTFSQVRTNTCSRQEVNKNINKSINKNMDV